MHLWLGKGKLFCLKFFKRLGCLFWVKFVSDFFFIDNFCCWVIFLGLLILLLILVL